MRTALMVVGVGVVRREQLVCVVCSLEKYVVRFTDLSVAVKVGLVHPSRRVNDLVDDLVADHAVHVNVDEIPEDARRDDGRGEHVQGQEQPGAVRRRGDVAVTVGWAPAQFTERPDTKQVMFFFLTVCEVCLRPSKRACRYFLSSYELVTRCWSR